MSLILPASYLRDKEEFLEHRSKEFSKTLEGFLEENADVKDPYFILFKEAPDTNNPAKLRAGMTMTYKRPTFIRGSLVFWVDNSRGLCAWLWTVDRNNKITFNKKGAKELQGILRSAAG